MCRIRRVAVRGTGVSLFHGGTIEGPPEIPRTSQHYHFEGIKGVPDLGTKGNGNIVFQLLCRQFRGNCHDGSLITPEIELRWILTIFITHLAANQTQQFFWPLPDSNITSAGRQTHSSRHNGDPIEGPPLNPSVS